MTITTLTEEHQQAREGCVYFPLEDFCLVEAAGKDTFSFLQSQTTNDVVNLKTGAGLNNALVDATRDHAAVKLVRHIFLFISNRADLLGRSCRLNMGIRSSKINYR